MKRIAAIALAAALLTLLFAGCRLRPKEIKNISYLYYTASNGMDIDDRVVYGLRLEGGVYTAEVKPEGIPEKDALYAEVDRAFVAELEELLRTNQVQKWHGYNKRSRNIMDGIGFTFALRMENGDEVEAVGYMNWPDNFGPVERGLDRLFGRVWDENRGE